MRNAIRMLRLLLYQGKRKLSIGRPDAIVRARFLLLRGRCRLTVAGRRLVLRTPSARQLKVMTMRLTDPMLEMQRRYFSVLGVLDPDIIVDVGANIGCNSITYSLLFPSSRILALEPSSKNFDYLLSNCATLANIKPLRIGAHDKDADVVLQMPSESENPNMSQKIHYGNTGLLSMYGSSGRWVESAKVRPLDLIVRDQILHNERIVS